MIKDNTDGTQFRLRLAPDLKAWLIEQAAKSRRSINAEITYRLERQRQQERREAPR